jgi:hypothetical protein
MPPLNGQNAAREKNAANHYQVAICGVFPREAPVGVEPTVADLQSAALATWLRRLIDRNVDAAWAYVKAGNVR